MIVVTVCGGDCICVSQILVVQTYYNYIVLVVFSIIVWHTHTLLACVVVCLQLALVVFFYHQLVHILYFDLHCDGAWWW